MKKPTCGYGTHAPWCARARRAVLCAVLLSLLSLSGCAADTTDDANIVTLQRRLFHLLLDLPQRNASALHLAVDAGDVAAVKLLLDSGADVATSSGEYTIRCPSPVTFIPDDDGLPDLLRDFHGITPLHIAAFCWNSTADTASTDGMQVVTALLALSVDVNAVMSADDASFTITPLFVACMHNNSYLATVLMDHGAHVNGSGTALAPLLIAAFYNNTETATLLLQRGADVNVLLSDFALTPLHTAVALGNTNLARILLKHGAFVNATTLLYDTPLHLAAKTQHEDCTALLLAHGASVDAKNILDGTPLHVAAKENALQTAAVLIAHGADVNGGCLIELSFIALLDKTCTTPLEMASKGNHTELAALLVAHGAAPRKSWSAAAKSAAERALAKLLAWARGQPPPLQPPRAVRVPPRLRTWLGHHALAHHGAALVARADVLAPEQLASLSEAVLVATIGTLPEARRLLQLARREFPPAPAAGRAAEVNL